MNHSDLVADNIWLLLMLLGLAVALTFVVFHWRHFEEGYEKGDAADPERIRKDNPPDEWCKSHWANK
jgi:hypothetical protein